MKLYYRFFGFFYKWAAKMTADECSLFINPGSSVLDFGCGPGYISKEFKNRFNLHEIMGLDITDNRAVDTPLTIYNGTKVPLEKAYDNVLVSFVLHHCENPELSLNEAKRLAKGNIIIYEDLPKGKISRFVCKLHEMTFRKWFQKNDEKGHFKSKKEWERIFSELGLKLIFEKKVLSTFVERRMFVLKKVPQ
jgi:ubiquinone/menaquinone biosynthesis C-methylase UbiE